jgi:hypothetical protein
MFRIEMRKGVCVREVRDGVLSWQAPFGDGELSAVAPTLSNAFAFIDEFTIDGGIITSSAWVECEGSYVLDVWDWTECWCTNPARLARIIAPPGSVPSSVAGQ